jgi:type IV pilus assembly protein PilN
MARINLLPWRADRRKLREREFYMLLGASAIAGVLALFALIGWMGARIDNQEQRNMYLKTEIASLDKQIEEIKELKSQIRNVLDRKQIVENLQVNRSQSVMMLDEISRQLPEGMYLRALKQQGHLVTLEGVADTNARVATLVRNLSGSEWLQSPNLVEIKSATVNGIRQNNFTVNAQLKAPPSPEDEVLGAKKGGTQ